MLARLALVLASPLHVAALSSTYYVLKHLYEETDGANWKNNENWLDGEPCQNDWMSSSHYEFFSGELRTEQQPICCQASAESLATVVKLDLYDNRLSGTIPPELKNLESMRLLVLDSNSLHGTIPPEIGDMYYLKVLWLQNNALSGTIPTELMKYLGAYDEDLGYTFDAGGVILTPNRFNCSIINAEGMQWANKSLDELFKDNVAPPEYNDRERDLGCIEDEDDLFNVSAVVMQVKAKEIYNAMRVELPENSVISVVLVFGVAAAVLLVIETLRRGVQRRARSMGAQTEEEKEEERAAQQQLRVGQLRQVELMSIERDRELDDEEAAQAKAGRASKASCRESVGGVRLSGRAKGALPNLPKAPRPTVTGFMGKGRRGNVPTTAPPTEADAFAEPSEKRRTLLSPSRFPLSPRRAAVPLAQATNPPTPATPTDPPTPTTPTPRASSTPAHTTLPSVESGDESGAYSSMSDSGMDDSASSQPRPVRPPRRSMDQKLRDKRAAAASKRDSAGGSAGDSAGGSAGDSAGGSGTS